MISIYSEEYMIKLIPHNYYIAQVTYKLKEHYPPDHEDLQVQFHGTANNSDVDHHKQEHILSR
jgi:hypothetical protein